jgi:germination protein M
MAKLMRTMALVAVMALLIAACGDDDDGATTTTAPPGTDTTTTTEATTTTTEPSVSTVSVYFLDGENLRVGHGREVEGMGVAASAVEALLEGPTADDEALGFTTSIPDGTTLLGLNIVDDLATVDLSGEFESGGGTLSMNARLAQVVYTITQFPSVRGVQLRLDGEDVEAIGGEGLMVDRPLTRADFEFGGDYEHLTPAILVERPRPGEQVGSSFEVSGRSNTFEAALNFEVVDQDGTVVIEEFFAMATSGTGTPGDFSETVELPSDSPADLILVAFERSARDGERINVVEVPIRASG